MAKPNPYKNYTSPLMLRLAPEQRALLEKACKITHQKMSDFVRQATMRQVNELLDETNNRKLKIPTEKAAEDKPASRFALRTPASVKGLDLGGSKKEEEESEDLESEDMEMPTPSPTLTPTIIIQSPGAAATTTDKFDDYAAYVLAGGSGMFDQQRRKDHIYEIIKNSTSNAEDVRQMRQTFEERLASAKTKADSSRSLWDKWIGGSR